MSKLKRYRKQIDEIDDKLISLFSERKNVVKKIGEIKKINKLPVLDKKRWREVLISRVEMGAKLNLNRKFVKEIFGVIHKESLNIERNRA